MKAYIANGYGGPDVMALGELPEPTPRKGEVVVTVRASSINPVDWKLRDGEMRQLTRFEFPRAFGCDFAGVVQAVGAGVSGWMVGDAVYGMTPVMFRKPGAHAERLAVDAKRLRAMPASLGFEQAASLPVAALTALNGLRHCGELAKKSIVVNGATGGVGHFALQLAKARGAKVTAVCSARNAERAKELGADTVIDYQNEDFTKGTARYDIVFDAFGKLGFDASCRAMPHGGIYITTLGTPSLMARAIWQRLKGGPRLGFANVRTHQQDYGALEEEILAGRVKPLIARTYPLTEAKEAFAAAEQGGIAGKIVIRMP